MRGGKRGVLGGDIRDGGWGMSGDGKGRWGGNVFFSSIIEGFLFGLGNTLCIGFWGIFQSMD